MKIRHVLFLELTISLFVFSLKIAQGQGAEDVTLCKSPDGKVVLALELRGGALSYAVGWDGQPMMAPSALGFEFADAPNLTELEVVGKTSRNIDESWKPVWGRFSEIRNQANEIMVRFREKAAPNRLLEMHLCAYDDGVAFRYFFPEHLAMKDVIISAEKTQFHFMSDGIGWNAESAVYPAGPLKLSQIASAGTPLVAQLAPDLFVAIHEAALDNFSTMNLVKTRGALRSTVFTADLSGTVLMSSPHRSPWRVIMLGKSAGALLESNLILNLNEPCGLKDTSWVKTGVSTWDLRNRGAIVKAESGEEGGKALNLAGWAEMFHLSEKKIKEMADDPVRVRIFEEGDFRYGSNDASMKRLIDYSAAKGLDWAMIDAGWYGEEDSPNSDPSIPIGGMDVPALAIYAKSKGVGLWLYVNSLALKTYDLDRTFSIYKRWGIVGIKHGFLSDTTQDGVELLHQVLAKSAQYQLLYICHEPIKPTGLRRTWPHFISSEFIHSLADGRKLSGPREHLIFPFVHNLAGPVDHTSGMFDLDNVIRRNEVHWQIQSTVVNQMARCIVYFSGILTLPDYGEEYEKKKDLFQVIAALPMSWDETRILKGEIGEVISVMRRKGDEWFIGSVTNKEGRKITIPLSFLPEGEFIALVCSDGDGAHYLKKRELYTVRTMEVSSVRTLNVTMAPGGGHVIWIKPKSKEK